MQEALFCGAFAQQARLQAIGQTPDRSAALDRGSRHRGEEVAGADPVTLGALRGRSTAAKGGSRKDADVNRSGSVGLVRLLTMR